MCVECRQSNIQAKMVLMWQNKPIVHTYTYTSLRTQAAEGELLRLSNRVRFIKGVISGSLRVNNRKKTEVEADLTSQGFDRLPSKAKVSRQALSLVVSECICVYVCVCVQAKSKVRG